MQRGCSLASNDVSADKRVDLEAKLEQKSVEVALRPSGRPPLSSYEDLAIAIRHVSQSDDPRQMHVGIFGLDDDDVACLVHQPWDHQPLFERNRTSLDRYSWLPALHVESEILRKQFLDHCMNLVEKNPGGVPYGLCYGEGDHFDPETKQFVSRDGAAGLTCATFVLELFRSYGIDLADRQTWVERAGDQVWADRMFSNLRNFGGPEIAERVRAQVEKFNLKPMRFRPEEVAAAGALYEGSPLTMSEVEPHGKRIVDEICGGMLLAPPANAAPSTSDAT